VLPIRPQNGSFLFVFFEDSGAAPAKFLCVKQNAKMRVFRCGHPQFQPAALVVSRIPTDGSVPSLESKNHTMNDAMTDATKG
jgi:hypothetical protein